MRNMPIILIIAFTLASCGKKCPCPPENIVPAYVGYQPAEIDTIVITRFVKGSNFSQAIDSIVLGPGNSVNLPGGDTVRIASIHTDFRINEKYDWQIGNPADNKLFQISEIQIDHQESRCGGLFSWDRQACASPVASFRKNGVVSTLDRGPFFSALVIKK